MQEKAKQQELQRIQKDGTGGLFITDAIKTLQYSFANNKAVCVVTGHEVDQASKLGASLKASMNVYASKRFFVFPYAIGQDHNIGIVVDKEKGQIRVYDHQNATRKASVQDKALQQIASDLGYGIVDSYNQSPYTAQKQDWECGVFAALSIEKDVERFQQNDGLPPKGEKETPDFDAELKRIWRIITTSWQELWHEHFPKEEPASWVKEKLEALSPAAYEPGNREALVDYMITLEFESTFEDKKRIDLLGIIDNTGAETLVELLQYINENSEFIKRYLPDGREEVQLHWLEGIARAYWFEKSHVASEERGDVAQEEQKVLEQKITELQKQQLKQNKKAAPWLFEAVKHWPEETLSAMYNIPLKDMQSQGATSRTVGQLVTVAATLGDAETLAVIDVYNQTKHKFLLPWEGCLWYAAKFGQHSSTEWLLERKSGEISANAVGSALKIAVMEGRENIVKLLINQRIDISPVYISEALGFANRNRYQAISALLTNVNSNKKAGDQLLSDISAGDIMKAARWLEKNPGIPDYFIRQAFVSAIGKISDEKIVDLLWKERPDIASKEAGKALVGAVEEGDLGRISFLLKHCPFISVEDAGRALVTALEKEKNVSHYTSEEEIIAAEKEKGAITALLLEQRQDIAAKAVGKAFLAAVKNNWWKAAVQLLERRKDISVEDVEKALIPALRNGKSGIGVLLLEQRHIISVEYVEKMLISMTGDGNTAAATLLLEKRKDISTKAAEAALVEAVGNKRWQMATQLLEKRQDIPAEAAGKALVTAVEAGQPTMAALLLKKWLNIPVEDAGKVLVVAAENGWEKATILPLLDRLQDIPVEDVGKALRAAAGNLWWQNNSGKKAITQLLEQRKDIPADDIGLALVVAICKRHINIITPLINALKGRDIAPSTAGAALIIAVQSGDTTLVSTLVKCCGKSINAKDVGEALVADADSQSCTRGLLKLWKDNRDVDAGEVLLKILQQDKHCPIKKMIEIKVKAISATHAGNILVEAAKNGHKDVVALLLKKRGKDISAEHAGEAVAEAAENENKDIANLLVKKVQFKNSDDTLEELIKAVKNGHTDLAKKLAEKRKEEWDRNENSGVDLREDVSRGEEAPEKEAKEDIRHEQRALNDNNEALSPRRPMQSFQTRIQAEHRNVQNSRGL